MDVSSFQGGGTPLAILALVVDVNVDVDNLFSLAFSFALPTQDNLAFSPPLPPTPRVPAFALADKLDLERLLWDLSLKSVRIHFG